MQGAFDSVELTPGLGEERGLSVHSTRKENELPLTEVGRRHLCFLKNWRIKQRQVNGSPVKTVITWLSCAQRSSLSALDACFPKGPFLKSQKWKKKIKSQKWRCGNTDPLWWLPPWFTVRRAPLPSDADVSLSRIFKLFAVWLAWKHPSAEKTVLRGSIPNAVQVRWEAISKPMHILCHLVALSEERFANSRKWHVQIGKWKKCHTAKIFDKLNPEILYKIPNLLIQSCIIILKRTTVNRTLVPIFSVK